MASLICKGNYMAMTEIIRQLEKEFLRQRADEQQLKNEIAMVASLDFAEQATNALDPKKHLYGFEGYLSLLQMLKTVLYEGMSPDDALDAVQTGWSAEKNLELWRYSKRADIWRPKKAVKAVKTL